MTSAAGAARYTYAASPTAPRVVAANNTAAALHQRDEPTGCAAAGVAPYVAGSGSFNRNCTTAMSAMRRLRSFFRHPSHEATHRSAGVAAATASNPARRG